MSQSARGVRRRLRAMMRSPRPPEVALAILLLFTLLVYVPLRTTFGRADLVDDLVVSRYVADVVPVSEVDPNGELILPTPPFAGFSSKLKRDARNPFAFYRKRRTPTPTPKPTPTPRLAGTPTPTPEPTPTPKKPYKTPLKLIGLLGDEARRIAVMKADDQIYVALEGWDVHVKSKDGKTSDHRVKQIGIGQIRVGPPDDDAEVVLKLKKDKGR